MLQGVEASKGFVYLGGPCATNCTWKIQVIPPGSMVTAKYDSELFCASFGKDGGGETEEDSGGCKIAQQ